MGAAGSIPNGSEQQRLKKDHVLSLFGKFIDESNIMMSLDDDEAITIADLKAIVSDHSDVFLTHDWGRELGKDNHARVSLVNDALKKAGIRTWFDSEKMEGNVKKKMIAGIDNARCILVFVTKRYVGKVAGRNAEDNCQLEFNYACRRKTGNKMIAVVMEERMLNSNAWTGEVGMVLGGSLYVNMSNDDEFESTVTDLVGRVRSMLEGKTINEMLDAVDWSAVQDKLLPAMHGGSNHTTTAIAPSLASPTSSPSTPAGLVSSPATPSEPGGGGRGGGARRENMIAAMVSWMEEHTTITPEFCVKYASTIYEAGVGTLVKLQKKVSKKPTFLGDLSIDEDDAEEILEALKKSAHGDSSLESGAASAALATTAATPIDAPGAVADATEAPPPFVEEPVLSPVVTKIIEQLETAASVSKVVELYNAGQAIKNTVSLTDEENEALMLNMLDAITSHCTSKDQLRQFGRVDGFFKSLLDFVRSRSSSSVIAEKGLCALKMLCRYGRDYSTQVSETTDALAKLGACEVAVSLLQQWHKDSASLCFNGLMLCGSLGADHYKKFFHTPLCSLCMEIMDQYVTHTSECNTFLALAISVCVPNLTRFRSPEITHHLGGLDAKARMQDRIVDNRFQTDEKARQFISTTQARMQSPTDVYKRGKELVNVLQESDYAAVPSKVENMCKTMTDVNALSEATGVQYLVPLLVTNLETCDDSAAIAALLKLTRKFCRFGPGAKTRNQTSASYLIYAGIIPKVVHALTKYGGSNAECAEFGAASVQVLAGWNQDEFVPAECLKVCGVLISLMLQYAPLSGPVNESATYCLVEACYNLSLKKTPEIMDAFRAVEAKSVASTYIVQNSLVLDSTSRDSIKEFIGRF